MYKSGGTIADALRRIQSKQFVLPAIQREFVWKPEQIERLLGTLPVDLADFDRFYEERRQSLRGRLSVLLEGAAAEQLPEVAE